MLAVRQHRPIIRRHALPGTAPMATSAVPASLPLPETKAPLAALRTRCQGRTVYVLASGPSLTPEDVAAVRATGRPALVTNTTFRLAQWADAIVANDRKWWRHYGPEIARDFHGLRFSGQPVGPDICNLKHAGIATYRNSGAAAISLALAVGATRVVCLGLDCAPAPDGSKHWHGAHPAGLGNAGSMGLWPTRFAPLAAVVNQSGIPVLNASRYTALDCFPRVALEEVL